MRRYIENGQMRHIRNTSDCCIECLVCRGWRGQCGVMCVRVRAYVCANACVHVYLVCVIYLPILQPYFSTGCIDSHVLWKLKHLSFKQAKRRYSMLQSSNKTHFNSFLRSTAILNYLLSPFKTILQLIKFAVQQKKSQSSYPCCLASKQHLPSCAHLAGIAIARSLLRPAVISGPGAK